MALPYFFHTTVAIPPIHLHAIWKHPLTIKSACFINIRPPTAYFSMAESGIGWGVVKITAALPSVALIGRTSTGNIIDKKFISSAFWYLFFRYKNESKIVAFHLPSNIRTPSHRKYIANTKTKIHFVQDSKIREEISLNYAILTFSGTNELFPLRQNSGPRRQIL